VGSQPREVLKALWLGAGLAPSALEDVTLSGADPVLPSSFAVGTAAQSSLAAAALAAAGIGQFRNGLRQHVSIDMRHAALECCGHFSLDGSVPPLWDPIAGLYPCHGGAAPGWVRLHTNFAHHRDGVLRLLGLPVGAQTAREAVAAALLSWSAGEFEAAASAAGLVVAALRTVAAWEAHPQSAAVSRLPVVAIERIGDAAPRRWPALARTDRPLRSLRVLDLTRILAGPMGGRTLAAYGAEVLLVNAPHLPNIAAIANTSLGKRSALVDLREPAGRAALGKVVRDCHVFIDGYRPGALAAFGFGAAALASACPGIVVVSLSAYGEEGPWAGRRGFDSLVQASTGLNDAEGRAAGEAKPRALPMQILDMASGFLIAFGAQAALMRQQSEGGSWQVRISLARTAQWLSRLGRLPNGFAGAPADFTGLLQTHASGFGQLATMAHSARFSETPAGWSYPSMPPGSHPLTWAGD
jgi:crotonobetainyl-CoA:carnitine CoA-transferase CaiB-like acyl-CoA transferase